MAFAANGGGKDVASSSCYGEPLLSPLLISGDGRLSSQPKTFANVFISIAGSGVLGLPYAIRWTGWASGVIMLLLVGLLTHHCMMLLVHIRRRLNLSSTAKIESFGDLGLSACGPHGRNAVDAMIVLTQAGTCVGNLIFIANTLTHLFSIMPKSAFIWATFPFQLGLNSIRSLTVLAPLSIFADVVNIGAMGVVMGEDVSLFFDHLPPLRAFGGISVIPYGLGVAVFAFEGICMVLPIESEAADKGKFGRTLAISMGFISAMYVLFGVLGYFAFGENTKDIITANFGTGIVTLLVQLGLCVNLFFTFPVLMHPAYEVAERWLCGKKYCLWLRWALVVAVSMVAMFLPSFGDFLSLVGSSVCCLLGFVLPALFHLRVFGEEMGWAGVSADVAIIVIGIVFAVLGTWSSLSEMIFSGKV